MALTAEENVATGVGVQLNMNGEALPLNTDISLYTSSRTTVTNSGADASYSYFTNPDSPEGQRPCRRSPYPLTITRRGAR
jgi:hypothetical protein